MRRVSPMSCSPPSGGTDKKGPIICYLGSECKNVTLSNTFISPEPAAAELFEPRPMPPAINILVLGKRNDTQPPVRALFGSKTKLISEYRRAWAYCNNLDDPCASAQLPESLKSMVIDAIRAKYIALGLRGRGPIRPLPSNTTKMIEAITSYGFECYEMAQLTQRADYLWPVTMVAEWLNTISVALGTPTISVAPGTPTISVALGTPTISVALGTPTISVAPGTPH